MTNVDEWDDLESYSADDGDFGLDLDQGQTDFRDREDGASSARPTQGYLRELLLANGLRPRRQLGQNFLIDLNLLELLVKSAQLPANAVVLEIGAGTGGLTGRLASVAAKVVAVEIDPGFHRLAAAETRSLENVTLLHADALDGKNRFNGDVLAALGSAMKAAGQDEFHLVSNLPYDVASSVVGNLIVGDFKVRSLTTTVQLEVGERMAASPGSKVYGPMSALIQRVGDLEWIRTLPPTVFWPRPKVDSCIVHINIIESQRQPLAELRRWHQWIRGVFMHRRKTLRSAIASVPGYKKYKPRLDELLATVDLTGDVRAENLSHVELFDLWKALSPLELEVEKDEAGR